MTLTAPDASAEQPSSATLNLTLLLAMQVAMQPQRPFLAEPEGRSWTFQETEAATAHVAGFFADLNLVGGERVALMTPNGPSAIVAFLGALRAGLQPVILPPVLRFEELVRAASATQPAAIIAQSSAGCDALDAAMRLAAAQSCVRFVMGVGPAPPRGVIDLGQRMTQARTAGEPARSDEVREVDALMSADADGDISTIVFEPLISTAADIVRATGLRSADRVVTPLGLGDGAGLASGLIAALFAGAELAPLDAPDSAAARAALAIPRPRHLVWPARHAGLARELTKAQQPLRSFIRRIHGDWRDLQLGRDHDLGADAVIDILKGDDRMLIVVAGDSGSTADVA